MERIWDGGCWLFEGGRQNSRNKDSELVVIGIIVEVTHTFGSIRSGESWTFSVLPSHCFLRYALNHWQGSSCKIPRKLCYSSGLLGRTLEYTEPVWLSRLLYHSGMNVDNTIIRIWKRHSRDSVVDYFLTTTLIVNTSNKHWYNSWYFCKDNAGCVF